MLLFLSAGIFFNSIWYDAVPYLLLFSFFIFCCSSFSERLILILLCLFGAGLFVLCNEETIYLLLSELFALTYIRYKNKTHPQITFFFIIAMGFIAHLYYIQKAPIDVHQHDLSGILFYIKMITHNGINFFDFNPWQMYYLFHQPLHFLIAGYLYFFALSLWNSGIVAQECLQYLSLFYVTSSCLFAGAIFKRLSFSSRILSAALLLFTFNPTLFLFSGYISNDVAVLFWTLSCFYFLICWHQQSDMKNIVFAAVCFGLGILSKLSILLITPAICLLFLHKLITHKFRQEACKQICVFVIIAVPLSLIWIVRNHILFDMPFYNIPDTSPAGQNFKYLTFWERISHFSSLWHPFINAPDIAEPNIWLALIKTELFGEWDLSLTHRAIFVPAFILYIANIFFKILSCLGGIKNLINYRKSTFLLYFFSLIYFIIWIYSFKYAMDYPYICSTDYRLFATLIIPEIIILISLTKKKDAIVLSIASLYTCLSCFIYIFGV